jgi:hypothetical protein
LAYDHLAAALNATRSGDGKPIFVRLPLGCGTEPTLAPEGRHLVVCRELTMKASAADNPMYAGAFAFADRGLKPFRQWFLIPADGMAEELRARRAHDVMRLAHLFGVPFRQGTTLPWLDVPRDAWSFDPDDFRDLEADAYVVVEAGRGGWGPQNKLLLGRGPRP